MNMNRWVGLTVLLAACGGQAPQADTAATAAAPVQAEAKPAAEAAPAATRPAAETAPAATRPATEARTQGAPTPSATESISIERKPCFGTCPVFTMTVASDGSVAFEGRNHVIKSGSATGRVSTQLARSLLHHADSIGVPSMEASYEDGKESCGRGYIADLPTVTLSVRRAGASKTIVADYGCQIPRSLRPLHARLDSIASALGWIPKP
jgi:hypothetical protein